MSLAHRSAFAATRWRCVESSTAVNLLKQDWPVSGPVMPGPCHCSRGTRGRVMDSATARLVTEADYLVRGAPRGWRIEGSRRKPTPPAGVPSAAAGYSP